MERAEAKNRKDFGLAMFGDGQGAGADDLLPAMLDQQRKLEDEEHTADEIAYEECYEDESPI